MRNYHTESILAREHAADLQRHAAAGLRARLALRAQRDATPRPVSFFTRFLWLLAPRRYEARVRDAFQSLQAASYAAHLQGPLHR